MLPMRANPVFKEGIALVLSRWTALQLAIENGWAGRDCPFACFVAEHFADVIFSWFAHSKEPLYNDDLEDFLDEFMENINTEARDGSIEKVASNLITMHHECMEGNYSSVESLRNLNPRPRAASYVKQVEVDADEEDDSIGNYGSCSMMEEDTPDSLSNSKESVKSIDEPTLGI